ncbi:MAG: RagB/SusD family nutrient uptake outer membrane protein [Tannerella sp.]|nr:RagB/SusD family nutrient uptake outer membrane protein [Tannerella sp.]
MKHSMNCHAGLMAAGVSMICLLTACNDFLDREPLSQITPDAYLNEESQLAAYAINLYPNMFVSVFGTGADSHTDDMASTGYDNRYVPGEWKTGQTGGSWSFTTIYSCNYFLERVLPLWKAGRIAGNTENINHYVGEMYFLRAFEYFKKYQEFGDFPIIRDVLPDQAEPLVDASKRYPRNEVARFILSDLDSAIMLLRPASPDGKNLRVSSYVAQLVKSRVALFEATWLKYFKDTPFAPNGPGWPGREKDYNASYQFPSGSIEGEIDYFLTQAMAAAQVVADNIPLVENNGILQQSESDPNNPYYDIYCAVDMSGYPEILLWRQYNKALGITHGIVIGMQEAGFGNGITRGMVDGFLMENGLPAYAPGSGYAGDDYISDVKANRDGRLQLFLKEPYQINVIWPSPEGTHATPVELIPTITHSDPGRRYPTGYGIRKGASFYGEQGGNFLSFTGVPVFRAAEAHLNYMEACYEKNSTLDAKARGYWTALRNRARMDADFDKTIAATEMEREKQNDWGACSAGQLIDATLYSIRRERRCELMAEGLRYMDLKRWRAMDRMLTEPYHIEGFKLWGPMKDWYNTGADGSSILIYGLDNDRSNVSSPERSLYLRPYEILSKSLALDGYRWTMAHYLSPIAIQNFLNTTEDNETANSPIYQNPGWPLTANQGPTNP